MSNALLASVAAAIEACRKCGLWRTCMHKVCGDGPATARIMIIGEAPGKNESLQGVPFVGRAGKFLDAYLEKAGISRKEVFVTNVLRCRPPENRDPSSGEVAKCWKFLVLEIEAIRPRAILTLGSHSTKFCQSLAGAPFIDMTRARGRAFHLQNSIALNLGTDERITVIPTWHPGYLLRQEGSLEKSQFLADIKKAVRLAKQTEIS